MKKKQKSDWCLSCRFWAFAHSYTGEKSREKALYMLSSDDCIYDKTHHRFIWREDLQFIWDCYVIIKPAEQQCTDNYTLNIYCDTGIEMECDCTNLKALIRDIAKQLA